MPHSAEVAVLLGGIANLGLALVRMFGLHVLVSRADKRSVVLMIYREIFVFLAFGTISLIYARELATTPLGFTVVITMALFLLLKSGEHIYVPEIRQERRHFEFALTIVGGGSYVWAATSGV